MFFSKNDQENVQKILSSTDGNKVQLHYLSSEVSELIKITRRLETVIDQLSNDFETLKSRMTSLENKVIPKLASPPTLKPKSKK